MAENHLTTDAKTPKQFWKYGVEAITKHGKRQTREYEIWCGMKRRCLNPSRPEYKNYGGRGITVCQRWIDDFQSFWDDMKCPAPLGLTLERINNDGPYSPDNCRWASRAEQCRNQRSNVLITHKGETRTATDWASHLGIPWQTVFNRIARGMSTEKVLTVGRFWKSRHGEGMQKLLCAEVRK